MLDSGWLWIDHTVNDPACKYGQVTSQENFIRLPECTNAAADKALKAEFAAVWDRVEYIDVHWDECHGGLFVERVKMKGSHNA